MENNIIYLVKGWTDATCEDDWFQCIGIDKNTFEIVDRKELIFESDVPDTSYGEQTWEHILELYKMKGWRLQ